MNKATYALIAAASLTISGLCIAQQAADQQSQQNQSSQLPSQSPAQSQAGQAAQSNQAAQGQSAADQAQTAGAQQGQSLTSMFPQQGVKNVQQTQDTGLQDAVAKLADASIQGDIQQASQQLDTQDQQKFAQADQASQNDLKQACDQLKKDFKDKYGQDLKIEGSQALAQAQCATAEVTDPSQLASSWPIQSMGAQQAGYQSGQSGQSQTGQAAQSGQSQTGQSAQSGQAGQAQPASGQQGQSQLNLKAGDKIGAIQLQGMRGQPVTVSCVQENGTWKVVPAQQITDSKQLAQNLTKHIQMVDQRKDQWPSDANQAQTSIARHVLMAYYDTGMGAGAQQSSFQQSGQSGQAGQAGQTSDQTQGQQSK